MKIHAHTSLALFIGAVAPSMGFAPLANLNQHFLERPRIRRGATRERVEGYPDGSKQIEDARRAFEDLLRDESDALQKYNQEAATSLLTSAGLERRRTEMSLLESLRDSDEAVDELMHFWVTERDPEYARQIFAMEGRCSPGLTVEHENLKRMMDEHPTWAEPVVRLATLLFFKGQTKEAYEVALDALELKPWHFEIPQLLILISLRNQDMKQALFWARRSLPALKADGDVKGNRRRHAWVENALRASHKQLEEAQEVREDIALRLATLSSPPVTMGGGDWQ